MKKSAEYSPTYLTELLEPHRSRLQTRTSTEDPEKDRVDSIESLLINLINDTTLIHALHQYKGTNQRAYLVGNSSDRQSLYMTLEGNLVFNESGTQYGRSYEIRGTKSRILRRVTGYEFVCTESSVIGIHRGDKLNIEREFGKDNIRGYENTTAESMLDRLKHCLQEMIYRKHGRPEEPPQERTPPEGKQRRRIYRNKQPMKEPGTVLHLLPGGKK